MYEMCVGDSSTTDSVSPDGHVVTKNTIFPQNIPSLSVLMMTVLVESNVVICRSKIFHRCSFWLKSVD